MKDVRVGILFLFFWLVASFAGLVGTLFCTFIVVYFTNIDSFPGASLLFGLLSGSGVAVGQWLFLRSNRLQLPAIWMLPAVAKWGVLVAVFQDTNLTLLAFAIGLVGAASEAYLLLTVDVASPGKAGQQLQRERPHRSQAIGLAGVAGEAWLLQPWERKANGWQVPAFLLAHYVVFFTALSLFDGAYLLIAAFAAGGLGYVVLLDRIRKAKK